MSIVDDLVNAWDDFKKDKHPFIVGLVAIVIISVVLIFLYFFVGTLADVLPPINPLIVGGIVIVAFLIYKFGVWLKKH